MADRDKRLAQAEWQPNANDLRPDGTRKGKGWLGVLPTKDEQGNTGVMTEKTVGVNMDGKDHDIPLIVPGLDKDEIDNLAAGRRESRGTLGKAVEHARKRIREGKSPYRQDDDE